MTQKQNIRQKKMLEIITSEGQVEVARLAEIMNVSRVTIRKDLDMFEDKGLIRHERGLVMPGSSDDISNRLSYHYDKKRQIAQSAATLVQDGETVMIESGACCAILAEELVNHKRDVTIITNSAFIAAYIRKLPKARTVLLGGDYQNEAQVMVGPVTRKCIEGFSVEKLFIGIDGFTKQAGFAGKDHLRAETVQNMAKQAQNIIILTESEKFFKSGTVPLLTPQSISELITDIEIPPEIERFLGEKGITIHKVTV